MCARARGPALACRPPRCGRVCALAVPGVAPQSGASTEPRAPRVPPGGRAEAAAGARLCPRARWPGQIYTSAFYHGTEQTLEQAQKNKLNMICEKMHLFKPGMRHLDIGCGWARSCAGLPRSSAPSRSA